MSRWWIPIAGGLGTFGLLEAVLVVDGRDPDPLRLALLVAVCAATLVLMSDALGDSGPSWTVDSEQTTIREVGDQRLTRYQALLEAHLSARTGDAALRDRLAVLADQVLRQQRGMARDDPAAVDLLGPELTDVLSGPARRLGRAEIDRCLTRIEEL